jgi:hypothetical protein
METRKFCSWSQGLLASVFFLFRLWDYWHCGHSWPLCQPRVIVKTIVEKQMECRLAGESEVLGENLPQRHFCPSQKPTWPDPDLTPGRRCGKPATNRLSYGAALWIAYIRASMFMLCIAVLSHNTPHPFLCYFKLNPWCEWNLTAALLSRDNCWMDDQFNEHWAVASSDYLD